MKHRDYVAQRELRDPEFRAAREANRAAFEFQVALIRARQDAYLTQAELAQRVGTTQSVIARWESGAVVPKVEQIQKLAAALGVHFEITPTSVAVIHPES